MLCWENVNFIFLLLHLFCRFFASSRERIYGVWSFFLFFFFLFYLFFVCGLGEKVENRKISIFVLDFKSSHPSELFDCILCFNTESFEFFFVDFCSCSNKSNIVKKKILKNFSWELGICIGLLLFLCYFWTFFLLRWISHSLSVPGFALLFNTFCFHSLVMFYASI